MNKVPKNKIIKNFDENGFIILKVFKNEDIKYLISIVKKRLKFLSKNKINIKSLITTS